MKSRAQGQCSNLFTILVTVYFVLLSPGITSAQEVGATLSGVVADPTGASVPEATVRATNQATGVSAQTTTNSNGDYVLPSLPPGTYTLNFEKTGFKTSVISNITLVVYQKARVDAHLEVGELSSTVSVEGAA